MTKTNIVQKLFIKIKKRGEHHDKEEKFVVYGENYRYSNFV